MNKALYRQHEDISDLQDYRIETLLELASMSGETEQAISNFVLDRSVRVTASRMGFLAYVNEDETELDIHAWIIDQGNPCQVAAPSTRFPLSTSGLWGESVRQRKPVMTNDYSADNPLKRGLPPGHVPVSRYLGVPLVDGDKVRLVVGVANKHEAYDDDDARHLTLLMDGLWKTLKNQRTTRALQDSERRLKASEHMLRNVLDTVPLHVFWKDKDLNYIGCNQRFARRKGLSSPDQVIGLDDFALQPEDLAEHCRSIDHMVMEHDQPFYNYDLQVASPSEGDSWLRVSKVPLRDDSGAIIGVLGMFDDVTERRHLELALKQSEERFRELVYNIPSIAVQGCLVDGTVVYWNKASEALFGYSEAEAVGRNYVDLLIPAGIKEQIRSDIAAMLESGQVLPSADLVKQGRDGSQIPVYTSYAVVDVMDKSRELFSLDVDMRERQMLAGELRIKSMALYLEKEQFRTTLLSVGDGVIAVDHIGRVRIMNSVAEQLTGWSQAEAEGELFEQIFRLIDERTREPMAGPVRAVLETGSKVGLTAHSILVSRSGREICIEESAAPIRSAAGEMQGVVLVFRDVTERRRIHSQIEHLSYHDYLTGLYNRRYFEEELRRLDTERGLPLSLIVVDVNGLKLTNDAFGHETGDALLRRVADILRQSCRAEDIIARMGGDEFAVLLTGTTPGQAESIRQRILQRAASETVASVVVSVAVGHDTKLEPGQDIVDVLTSAENAMYRDKISSGKKMRNQTIALIVDTINNRYVQEQAHTEAIARYCRQIGMLLGLTGDDLRELEMAGMLHDIGKVMVPAEILGKQGPLTEDEYLVMQRHAEAGYQILRSVDELTGLAEIALTHHERWDGTGYPQCLSGEDIPLFARIIAIADAFEAMTAGRIYRDSLTLEQAVAELEANAGSQFDPELVSLFVSKVTGSPHAVCRQPCEVNRR